MRELKFRAWVYYGQKLEKPHYSRDYASLDRFFEDYDENDIEQCIEQYTGLKDKNGKEIYDGDIMTTFDGKLNAVIIWRNNTAGWGIKWTDTDIEDSLMHRMGGLNPSIRLSNVIGNIHENPELLERQK